ncbi:MAG: C69 family dipeptidase [Hyphomicrobiaceae bacterium]
MSYGIYVGRNLGADGHAWLAGYGDEPSSHWLEVVPARTHAPGATLTVGVTPEAALPGRLSRIPEAPETFRHIRVSYSHYLGVPAPLTNGGLNEHGVAVRDIWSPSRPELVAMTPADQTGPNYSDLARIVIERARTAEEGVNLIGELIARHGYSTYGGNSHLIADAREAFVVIEFAGGRGLWVAERLGPDEVRVSRPGYIGEIPPGERSGGRFLFPDHFMAVATECGWYDPASGAPFDVNRIYGDGKLRWEGVAWMEGELRDRAARSGGIGFHDLAWALRTSRLTGDTAGYGQIVPLKESEDPALRMLWHAHIGAVAAQFVPLVVGIEEVPEEYRMHRYLTDGEAARFLDHRHAADRPQSVSRAAQGIESTRSATAVSKRLLYLVLQHEERFLPELTEVLEATERRLWPQAAAAQRAAGLLIGAGERELATGLLTYFSSTELQRALSLAETLAAAFEARTRALHGISTDPVPRNPKQIW